MAMIIRHGQDDDIPKIIELLKLSLGESLMPKSEMYWQWKHIDNPFGRSPVLVAEEEGQLIGVRAFMRWEWSDGNSVCRAVRAVDTATHPGHQGKGIFKKLTLQLIEECKAENTNLIFNTPNNQSKPGYLKMGWEEAGRLPVRFQLVNPIGRLYARLVKSSLPSTSFSEWCKTHEALKLFSAFKNNSASLKTVITKDYLIWRYSSVPVAGYFAITEINGENYEVIIYRLKPGKIGLELRITEYFTNQSEPTRAIYKKLKQCAYASGATYIIHSGAVKGWNKGLSLNRGPIVTVRDLAYADFSGLINFENWQPSLGDLELF